MERRIVGLRQKNSVDPHSHFSKFIFSALNGQMEVIFLTACDVELQINEATMVQSFDRSLPISDLVYLAEVFTGVQITHNRRHKLKRGPICPKGQANRKF